MRKFLAILLALSLVFSMSALAFAEDDADVADADAVEEEAVTEDEGSDFEIPVPEKVVVSTQPLKIDGKVVDVQPYNIDGANYFKLRDLAALVNGTGSQFSVDFKAPNMIVATGKSYTKIAGDLEKGADLSSSCVPSKQVLVVDEEQVDILVYNIGGNNYFQLRGLGDLVGFEVDYDAATRTMLVATAGYTASEKDDDAEGPYFVWWNHPTDTGNDDEDYVEVDADPTVFTLTITADGTLKSITPAIVGEDFDRVGKGEVFIYGNVEPEGNKINLPNAFWEKDKHYKLVNDTGLAVNIAREYGDVEVTITGAAGAKAGTIEVQMALSIVGGADKDMIEEIPLLQIKVVVE